MQKKRLMKRVATLFISVILLRSGYRFFTEEDFFLLTKKEKQELSHPGVFDNVDGLYDFRRMVVLIEHSKKIKNEIAAQSAGFFSRIKPIYIQEICDLLHELQAEVAALRMYIWDLKGFAGAGIPIRKYRGLLYYQEILDECIVDMEEIINRRTCRKYRKSKRYF